MTVKWSLSVLDWRSHVITVPDKFADGVVVARCGHQLIPTVVRTEPIAVACRDCVAAAGATSSDTLLLVRLASVVGELQQLRKSLREQLRGLAGDCESLTPQQLRWQLSALAHRWSVVDLDVIAVELAGLLDAYLAEQQRLVVLGAPSGDRQP
jgi:hypothetical protein